MGFSDGQTISGFAGLHCGREDSADEIRTIARTADASVVVVTQGGRVDTWDVSTGKLKATFAIPGAYNPVLNDIGTRVAVNEDGVQVWDVATGELMDTINADKKYDGVRSMVFSPDGNTLAVGYQYGNVKLWHSDGMTETLSSHSEPVTRIAFSRDNTMGNW